MRVLAPAVSAPFAAVETVEGGSVHSMSDDLDSGGSLVHYDEPDSVKPLPAWARAMKHDKQSKCKDHQAEERRHWTIQNWAQGIIAVVSVLGFFGAVITVCLSYKAFRESQRQADAAQVQVKIMQDEQRPWISLELQPEGPLTRDSNGWNFIVKYALNNVGKSPAFDVDFYAVMIPLGDVQRNPPPREGFSFALPTEAIHAAAEAICRVQERWPAHGEVMFPGIQQILRYKPHSEPVGPGFIPGFVIIGCATYKFAGDSKVHETVRIFELTKRTYGEMVDLNAESIAADDLAFFPHRGNGSRAN